MSCKEQKIKYDSFAFGFHASIIFSKGSNRNSDTLKLSYIDPVRIMLNKRFSVAEGPPAIQMVPTHYFLQGG